MNILVQTFNYEETLSCTNDGTCGYFHKYGYQWYVEHLCSILGHYHHTEAKLLKFSYMLFTNVQTVIKGPSPEDVMLLFLSKNSQNYGFFW